MNTLMPISTLPADATSATVQLYRQARQTYGMGRDGWVSAVEECIPCRDFWMTVQDATLWCPRERPLPNYPKVT